MLRPEIIFREVAAEEIKIDTRELSARLGGYCTACSDIADGYAAQIFSVATPKYACVRCDIDYTDDGAVVLVGKKIHSEALIKNLSGAKSAFILAVTLGAGVDTYLRRTAVRSGVEHYFSDGVASAICDGLCDLAEREVCKGLGTSKRFSPGYADLPLSLQTDVLNAVGAERLLGITLTSSMLMIPTKSITAIIGIK